MLPIIEVNHISKKYRIGEKQSYYSFRDSIVNTTSKLIKMLAPRIPPKAREKDEFWALKDISFKVMPGEVVGIIGRNGAGKSTLLKILSRITPPTKGEIILRGRSASLLEVGTGFSSELSGRENIYLNGAILGMKRTEINDKFDEIIEFSGISKFLDTPVKHYSSGMYMRLAFSIAAHLEPEILLVDEVLAVGDIEFQKKCLGKMEEVSKNQGRAVLFVSHNMVAISQLCSRCLLLDSGKITSGKVLNIVDRYMTNGAVQERYISNQPRNKFIREIKSMNEAGKLTDTFHFTEEIRLHISIQSRLACANMSIGVAVLDRWGKKIFTSIQPLRRNAKTKIVAVITIPSQTLLAGKYAFDVAIFIPNVKVYDYADNICAVSIVDADSEFAIYNNSDIGPIAMYCKWKFY